MTKIEALNSFFSSFGLESYEENAIYAMLDPPDFPYLTYEIKSDSFSQTDTALSMSLWYKGYKWSEPMQKAEEISKSIGRIGKRIKCNDGYILIMRGSPFWQAMGDDPNDKIKRIFINITVRFYTND